MTDCPEHGAGDIANEAPQTDEQPLTADGELLE
jgi:hypothetical protein